MKRFFVLLLALIFCFGALADTGIDWSQYSDEEINNTLTELQEMMEEAQAELDNRNKPQKPLKPQKPQNPIETERKTMGITTQQLLDDFAAYRLVIGVKPYSTELFEREKTSSYVNLSISDYCRISIKQENGEVVNFTVLTDDVEQTDASIQDVITTFTGILMVSNNEIDNSNAFDILTNMVEKREDITIGGITYHYLTSKPMTNIIALQATLAKD